MARNCFEGGFCLECITPAVESPTTNYPDWATNKILHNLHDDKETSIKLSDREIEFLNYAATELTYKEIAEKMFCSPRTVESYRDALFEKLNLKTRVGLVVYGIKNGIIKS